MIETKRQHGQYYTVSKNPFALPAFRAWADEVNLKHSEILEPYAGANHIVDSLRELDLCKRYQAFDVAPSHCDITQRDTIQSFPQGFNVCVTNPPWLARNSATRRRIPYPNTKYDDLYKLCIELCLENCEYVAALLPASFLQSGLFRDRLSAYILLHEIIFVDTENPVCLALFKGSACRSIEIHYDEDHIGELATLESYMPRPKAKRLIRFNDPQGQLGLITFDDTRSRTIRFCEVSEIEDYEIKVSSRFITRISVELDQLSSAIKELNQMIEQYRDATHDLFLTPFKGLRADRQYRRRMFFSLAREFINAL